MELHNIGKNREFESKELDDKNPGLGMEKQLAEHSESLLNDYFNILFFLYLKLSFITGGYFTWRIKGPFHALGYLCKEGTILNL